MYRECGTDNKKVVEFFSLILGVGDQNPFLFWGTNGEKKSKSYQEAGKCFSCMLFGGKSLPFLFW